MANFIRIGNRVINTELVTDISVWENGQIIVSLAAPAKDSVRRLTFENDDAAALQKWIQSAACEWTSEGENQGKSFSFSYVGR